MKILYKFLPKSPRQLRGRCLIVLLLAGITGLLPVTNSIATEDEFVIGVFPRRNPSEMMEMFQPLANYLSQELRRPVKLETTADFRSFWEAVASQRFDLVHYNQYHYVRSHKEFGYEVIAKNEEINSSSMAGVILTRKDSGINSLQDLKGKRIIFGGGKMALMSYIIPTYLLRQAGLNKGDYTEEFALNPPNVALSVFFRRAVAGGSGDLVFDMPFVREKINVSKMKYLATSMPVPQLAWAVRGDVPEELRARLQKILVNVKSSPDSATIFKAASLTNLITASDKEYDTIRELIKSVVGEQY